MTMYTYCSYTTMRGYFRNMQRLPIEYIKGAKNLVEYSFIFQKSVTYLDLSLCEFSKLKWVEKIQYHYVDVVRVVYTEEACKKRLASNRDLLYKFHLDVSKELELSLRNPENRKLRRCYSYTVLLNEVFTFNTYEIYLNNFIKEALDQPNKNVKLIRQISKMAKYMKFISKNECIFDRGIDMLYSQDFHLVDLSLVKDFLTAMDFNEDNLFSLSQNKFEFVLYHANRSGRSLWSSPSCEDPIHVSISCFMYLKTETLFQYRNAPRFCDKAFETMINYTSWLVPQDLIAAAVEHGFVTEKRLFLILQILHVSNGMRSSLNGEKALQMLWRSIPDPFITLLELTSVLPLQNSRLNEKDIYEFIQDITGADVITESQPRKLKHYCRIVIRRLLKNTSLLWASVHKLVLPPILKSYLRLEN